MNDSFDEILWMNQPEGKTEPDFVIVGTLKAAKENFDFKNKIELIKALLAPTLPDGVVHCGGQAVQSVDGKVIDFHCNYIDTNIKRKIRITNPDGTCEVDKLPENMWPNKPPTLD